MTVLVLHVFQMDLSIRARLLKGLIAYPVDNYNFINIISELLIDYLCNILHF